MPGFDCCPDEFSPCVDAGTPKCAQADDITGAARPAGTTCLVDMEAFEKAQ